MAVVLPVNINVEGEAAEQVEAVEATAQMKMGIPPADDDSINNVTVDPSAKKEPTLLNSTTPIKKGSSPPPRDFVSPKEVTVTLTEDHVEHKALEVPTVKKAPPCYGPNNSARRANRRKGEAEEAPAAARPSSPLLTPDSRSPASSRPASPFSPACSTPARRKSVEVAASPAPELAPPRRLVMSKPSSLQGGAASAPVTPHFTHPALKELKKSRSTKDTRAEGCKSDHDGAGLVCICLH